MRKEGICHLVYDEINERLPGYCLASNQSCSDQASQAVNLWHFWQQKDGMGWDCLGLQNLIKIGWPLDPPLIINETCRFQRQIRCGQIVQTDKHENGERLVMGFGKCHHVGQYIIHSLLVLLSHGFLTFYTSLIQFMVSECLFWCPLLSLAKFPRMNKLT